GVPQRAFVEGFIDHPIRPEPDSTGNDTTFLKWVELDNRSDYPQNDFTLQNVFFAKYGTPQFTPVLMQTPWIFTMSPAWHLSYLDRLWLDAQLIPLNFPPYVTITSVGSWLPFFYNDKKRTFFVLPARAGDNVRSYYPE